MPQCRTLNIQGVRGSSSLTPTPMQFHNLDLVEKASIWGFFKQTQDYGVTFLAAAFKLFGDSSK